MGARAERLSSDEGEPTEPGDISHRPPTAPSAPGHHRIHPTQPVVGFSSVPPVGFRLWRVVAADLLGAGEPLPYLSSPYKELLWQGPDEVARCRAVTNHFHPPGERVPVVTCKCGIYATKEPSPIDIGGLVAAGQVELWGRVLEGALGYRGARVRIIGALQLRLGCIGTDARPAGAGVYPRSHCKYPVTRIVRTGRQFRGLCSRHSYLLLTRDVEAEAVDISGVMGWLEARYRVKIELTGRYQT
ncbi:MAG: hypothetical protein ACT4OP_05865 [Actinomycetota bacterium]